VGSSPSRTCALEGCGESLEGMAAAAIYHSRRCKLVALKRRQRAEVKAAERAAERAALEAQRAAAERAAERTAMKANGLPLLTSQRPDNPSYDGDSIYSAMLALDRDAQRREREAARERGDVSSRRPRHRLAAGVVL